MRVWRKAMSDSDPTEQIRRAMVDEININPGDRASLEKIYGEVWSGEELARDFKILGFMAPFVSVTRKSDGKYGFLEFQHSPRFYFNWQEDQ